MLIEARPDDTGLRVSLASTCLYAGDTTTARRLLDEAPCPSSRCSSWARSTGW